MGNGQWSNEGLERLNANGADARRGFRGLIKKTPKKTRPIEYKFSGIIIRAWAPRGTRPRGDATIRLNFRLAAWIKRRFVVSFPGYRAL